MAVVPARPGPIPESGMAEHIDAQAEQLIGWIGMRGWTERRGANLAVHWMIGNLATLLADTRSRWPACLPDLTDEVGIWPPDC